MEKKFLLPGEYFVTRKPMTLVTVLGSCVSVCLYNETSKLAAMNHFVFPEGDGSEANSKGRYGNTAMDIICRSLFAVDGNRKNYKARLFGGATPLRTDLGNATNIGLRNIDAAEAYLANEGIPVVEKITGSQKGYRIYFDTSLGRVKTEEIKSALEKENEVKDQIASGKIMTKKVLVVDDSALVRKVLSNTINSLPGYTVCGQAADAYEARDMLVNLSPDVMTLDIIMPKLDGVSFLRKVTQHFPLPVIICSTIAKEGTAVQKDALNAGAMEVIDKDTLELYKGEEQVKKVIRQKLDSAIAKFKVTKRL
ncbi:MAG: response regulator [Lentisphaeraceae bacterium]|nr:response regulator [Lentisphaeraceae bacterium]